MVVILPRDQIYNDVNYNGTVQFTGPVTLPDSAVKDSNIAAGADISYEKTQHVDHAILSQENQTAATQSTRSIYIARAVGTVIGVKVTLMTVAVGDSTASIDVMKSTGGGALATILTGTVDLDSGDAAFVAVAGTLSGVPTLIAGDVIAVEIGPAVGTGTLMQGICVDVTIAEQGA